MASLKMTQMLDQAFHLQEMILRGKISNIWPKVYMYKN